MITFDKDVMLMLQEAALATRNEFSGFGFVNRVEGGFFIYDAVILNVGTYGYTQINPEELMPLLDRSDAGKLKCWVHRHPLGNGIPGPQNWSGRDEKTIQEEPMGGIPDLVKWSLSVVLTPDGWVGRVDNHQTKKTKHLAVAPQSPVRALIHQLQAAQLVEEDEEDEEDVRNLIVTPEWLKEATERTFSVGDWLAEYGFTEEEFQALYEEEYGSHTTHGDLPGTQPLGNPDRGRGHRLDDGRMPRENGRARDYRLR